MWYFFAVLLVVLGFIEYGIRKELERTNQRVLNELSTLRKDIAAILAALDPDELARKIEAMMRAITEARAAANREIDALIRPRPQTPDDELKVCEQLAAGLRGRILHLAASAGIDEAELERRKKLRELSSMEELAEKTGKRIEVLKNASSHS